MDIFKKGYGIIEEMHETGVPKLFVSFHGEKIEDNWFLDRDSVIASAWQHCYGEIACKYNEETENKAMHILAWKLSNGDVYAVDHLDHYVPPFMEEVFIATYPDDYEISKMICVHCGEPAVDDEVLREYGLLYDEEEN